MRKSVVRERPLRIDVVLDDLADRVGFDVVDALESGNDSLFWRGKRGRHRHQAGVASAFRGRFVGRLPQQLQAALAAGGDWIALEPLRDNDRPSGLVPSPSAAPARPVTAGLAADLDPWPFRLEETGGLQAGVTPGLCEFPAGRNSHLDDVGALPNERLRLLGRGADLVGAQGHSQPWLVRQTQHVAHVPGGGLVVVESGEGRGEQLRRVRLGCGQTLGPLEQFRLEPEVDRTRRDFEPEIAGRQLVFEQGDGEGEDDAPRQPRPIGAAVALRHGCGQRSAGAIEAVHAEHAQDRALLGDRGRAARGWGEPGGEVGRVPANGFDFARNGATGHTSPRLGPRSRG